MLFFKLKLKTPSGVNLAKKEIPVVNIKYINYGNTGCGVFKGGIQNLKDFWLKINCRKMKLLNFENWSNQGVPWKNDLF